jgi:hypothetical protein
VYMYALAAARLIGSQQQGKLAQRSVYKGAWCACRDDALLRCSHHFFVLITHFIFSARVYPPLSRGAAVVNLLVANGEEMRHRATEHVESWMLGGSVGYMNMSTLVRWWCKSIDAPGPANSSPTHAYPYC